jgi:hypothetical protein
VHGALSDLAYFDIYATKCSTKISKQYFRKNTKSFLPDVNNLANMTTYFIFKGTMLSEMFEVSYARESLRAKQDV